MTLKERMALLQKRQTGGGNSDGEESGKDGPCSNYRVDMLADKFGACKCGYAKASHSAAAFKGAGGASKRGGGGARARDIADSIGKRVSGRFPQGFQLPGMKVKAPSSAEEDASKMKVESTETEKTEASTTAEAQKKTTNLAERLGKKMGGFKLPSFNKKAEDASKKNEDAEAAPARASKPKKAEKKPEAKGERTRDLAARLGKTISGRFQAVGAISTEEQSAPSHEKANETKKAEKKPEARVGRTRDLAARLGKTISGRFQAVGAKPDDVAAADSDKDAPKVDNSAILNRPVISRGRRRKRHTGRPMRANRGVVAVRAAARLSMRKSNPPVPPPAAQKKKELKQRAESIEKDEPMEETDESKICRPSSATTMETTDGGFAHARQLTAGTIETMDSMDFDDSDAEKAEEVAMELETENESTDDELGGRSDTKRSASVVSATKTDEKEPKAADSEKGLDSEDGDEDEEFHDAEDDDEEEDEEGGDEKDIQIGKVASSEVFDESKHRVAGDSQLEFLDLNIEFKSGTLGFTFSRGANTNASLIVVTKVKEGTQASGKVAVGDIITKIGDHNIESGVESASIVADIIKKVRRPVTITFKRSMQHLLAKLDPRMAGATRQSMKIKDDYISDLFQGGDAPRRKGEYDIKYKKEAVGFKASSSSLGIRVQKSMKKMSKKAAALEQRSGFGSVFAGDYVLAVGSTPTIALPEKRYEAVLNESGRPVVIRFRRAIYHEMKLPSFEVTIGGNMSIGGEVLASKTFNGVMIITNLSMSGGLMLSGSVREGDWLVSVNGTFVDGKTVKAVNKMLRSSARPASLVFSRPLLGTAAKSKHMSVMRRPDEFSLTTPVIFKEKETGMTLEMLNGRVAVATVKRRGAADKAKVQKGDLLTAIGGVSCPLDIEAVNDMLAQFPRPSTLMFERLSVRKVNPDIERMVAQFEKGRLGFGLKDHRLGVTVVSTTEKGQAAKCGMKPGDVIVEVGGISVRRLRERDVGGMLKTMPRPLEVVYLRRSFCP